MRHDSKTKILKVSKIKKLFSRRFYYLSNSVEIFFENGRAYFFNFYSEENQSEFIKTLLKINQNIISILNPIKDFRNSNLLEKWQRREISTFEYLMHLNVYSGRSSNLIFQYHIFPWILMEYKTSNIDFNQHDNFRSFQDPIGCLNKKTKEICKEKYNDFEDQYVPKFHHGTHYSTYGHILYYLIRLSPFTELAKDLQGGKIDLADRLFSEIESTWNACLNSMGDVKELIPEFFFLPLFLNNM